VRVKIPNIDRVGLVLDISQALAVRKINIISMEVELTAIYLETEQLAEEANRELNDCLHSIPGIVDVVPIDLMPHQEKSEQLKMVLDSASDGIVAIDRQARITQYNPAAERILRIPAEAALGRVLTDVLPTSMSLLDALQAGTDCNNREIILENTNSHYVVSSRPLIGHMGQTVGAMAILKDIRDVRELVHKITGQRKFTFEEILYKSKAMQQVIALAETYARGDSTVLIRGETGTGKELFARALHAASPRSDKIFVPVNCAAIPDTLLESELFGYEEGAFTGAAKGGKPGLFELANGGTIFLDEIGEISSHLQAKLLRVLQDRKVRRIGSAREIAVNVRILAATNRHLEDMIAQGNFREDLYYRLNVIPLFLPSLRERREDISVLAQFFLRRFSIKLNKMADVISEGALAKLEDYHWPGNIRELENVVERAVNILEGRVLQPEHVVLYYDHLARTVTRQPVQRTLEEMLDETEREILVRALRQHRTSRQLGKVLGLSHTAVLNKLRKHGLMTPRISSH
jgi:transcriptional regulator of aroF, aroG, tyrA and aromatic amino acid transport